MTIRLREFAVHEVEPGFAPRWKLGTLLFFDTVFKKKYS